MRHRTAIITLTVAVGLLLAAATVALAASPRNFAAPLSGDQEVPAVDTDATGVAKFQLTADGDALTYRLNVANIENVTQAHIHQAPRGENGAVVVWLYPEDGPPAQLIEGRTDGTLATGTITADDFVGPLAGAEFDALIEVIREGNAYVNVHTKQFPGGEIRGQIDVPRSSGSS